MKIKNIKLQIYHSLRYLLFHEDYIDLNINQKIEAKDFYIKYSLKK